MSTRWQIQSKLLAKLQTSPQAQTRLRQLLLLRLLPSSNLLTLPPPLPLHPQLLLPRRPRRLTLLLLPPLHPQLLPLLQRHPSLSTRTQPLLMPPPLRPLFCLRPIR